MYSPSNKYGTEFKILKLSNKNLKLSKPIHYKSVQGGDGCQEDFARMGIDETFIKKLAGNPEE
jgi:hypothetical protein